MYALSMRPKAQVGDQEYPSVFSRDMSGTAWRVWSRLFVVVIVSQMAPIAQQWKGLVQWTSYLVRT